MQVDERGLAGAGRADDGDGLAGLGDERQVLDQRVVRVVRERDVVELDPTAGVGVVGRHGVVVGLLLGRVEQLEDPLGRGDARLEHVDHRRELGERLRELAGVLDERLHVAERHARPTTTRRPPITAMTT